jgi:hypothetical protein
VSEEANMKASALKLLAVAVLTVALTSCATGDGGGGSVKLVDGTKGLENFNRVGQANWTATDGAIQATQGGQTPAYLVSKNTYRDFAMKVEFWASDDANSGIFMRCQDANKITDESCYEANIFDQRPDPTYGTGAIVKVAPVAQPMPKAGGKWNTFDITMRGDHLVVVLNGQKTVDTRDAKFASGPVALQWGRGTIKFRKVEIKPI